MTLPDTHVTVLPDGRDLAWLEIGKPDGEPVFAFHGTTGSRWHFTVDGWPIAASGVRLIATDRPGYGLSSFRAGRRLWDWADDVAFLADHLGLEHFSVLGVSGGGPHAAACARFLPARVRVAAILSGVAPLADAGSEEGMMATNQRITTLARRAPVALWPLFGGLTALGRRWPERALQTMIKQLPPPDAAVLMRPEVRDAFFRDLRQAAPTTGRAAAQDFRLFVTDWGFRLEDITVPVHIWQGDVDRNVPPAHARYQAERIPEAVLHEIPGEGHMLFVDHLQEILGELIAAAARAPDSEK
ncbi:MAG: alpha/beta hydrolase [Acidimicrobiaceae bacterium]|nr:alpha/beta hydrolase [Acidimicrobiaceae bacterium]